MIGCGDSILQGGGELIRRIIQAVEQRRLYAEARWNIEVGGQQAELGCLPTYKLWVAAARIVKPEQVHMRLSINKVSSLARFLGALRGTHHRSQVTGRRR